MLPGRYEFCTYIRDTCTYACVRARSLAPLLVLHACGLVHRCLRLPGVGGEDLGDDGSGLGVAEDRRHVPIDELSPLGAVLVEALDVVRLDDDPAVDRARRVVAFEGGAARDGGVGGEELLEGVVVGRRSAARPVSLKRCWLLHTY